jgi:hypothetical protein
MVIDKDPDRYGLDIQSIMYAPMAETKKLTSKFLVYLEDVVKLAGFQGITDYETNVGTNLTNAVTELCAQARAADGRRVRLCTSKIPWTRVKVLLNAELGLVGHRLVSNCSGRGANPLHAVSNRTENESWSKM